MDNYKYKLGKSSRKYLCPNCNKQRFVRYINTETNEYLPEQYGRCDREADCAYHLNPYIDGFAQRLKEDENSIEGHSNKYIPSNQTRPKTVTFIPREVLKKTRQGWVQNIFLQNLLNRVPFPFEPSDIEKIIVHYQLGTVLKGYMAGAVTFPFIDEMNNIRTIQVEQFDESNHTTTTTFLHSIIEKNLSEVNSPIPEWLKQYNENELKVSCLFGAHLLPKYPNNPVALVEAPKSAIIGTLYYGFPDKPERLLWLAVYNLSSLSFEKCRALKGRTVILFPDLSKEGTAFQLWSEKAKTMEKQLPGTRFIVNNLLEQKASIKAKSKGYDLADYLIQFNHCTFVNKNPEQLSIHDNPVNEILTPSEPKNHNNVPYVVKTILHKEDFSPTKLSDKKQPLYDKSWDIDSLQIFFNSIQLPQNPINLDQCSNILDLPKFISGHLAVLHTYNGNPVFLPYLNRLQKLQHLLASLIEVNSTSNE